LPGGRASARALTMADDSKDKVREDARPPGNRRIRFGQHALPMRPAGRKSKPAARLH